MRNILIAAALLLPMSLRAIELSLEENRAQRGNIGYVDMQKVFKLFPETIRAKENFDEVVRQAEEQINARKTELIRLRAEISQLKLERDLAAKNMPQNAPPAPTPIVLPAPAVQASTQALPAAVVLSTPSVAGSTFAVQAATEPSPLASLPGVPPPPVPVPVPVAVPAPAPVAAAPAPLPVPAPAPANPLLAELDDKISHKSKWLAQKEEDFRLHQAEAEKNLLDLEGKKTEILLGRIHKVVRDVSRAEGISVVVDKGSILFGHDAVDLTDRVLKALKGS